jgi:hypothetical protein
VRDKRIGGPVSGEFGDLSSPAPFFVLRSAVSLR